MAPIVNPLMVFTDKVSRLSARAAHAKAIGRHNINVHRLDGAKKPLKTEAHAGISKIMKLMIKTELMILHLISTTKGTFKTMIKRNCITIKDNVCTIVN